MHFNSPNFLWALWLLLVPVIIHLFNFRRYRKVVFSNVEMLRNIKTESKHTRQVKKWLILASRLLTVLFLVLAFARPFIPIEGIKSTRQLVSIYLDNSYSMDATGEQGMLFEVAKNNARSILEGLPTGTPVQVLNNQPQRASSRALDFPMAIKRVDDMELTHTAYSLSDALSQVSRLRKKGGYDQSTVFVLSDLQKGSVHRISDSAMQIYVVPSEPSDLQNISIDSAWVDEPVSVVGSPVEMSVRLTNHGTDEVPSTTLRLTVEDEAMGLESFSLAAGETKVLRMAFQPSQGGVLQGKLSVDDVPVVFDNDYYFTLQVKSRLRVLLWGKENARIEKVFRNDSLYTIEYIEDEFLNATALNSYDLIVANEKEEFSTGRVEEFKKYTASGGVLCIVPSENGAYSALSRIAPELVPGPVIEPQQSLNKQGVQHPFYRDVFQRTPRNTYLPEVKNVRALKGGQTLLETKNGRPVFIKHAVGNGVVYQWAMPLTEEYGNLVNHELFVVSFLKMVLDKPAKQQLAYVLDPSVPVVLAGVEEDLERLRVRGEETVFVDFSQAGGSLAVYLNEAIAKPGVYDVVNDADLVVGRFALNGSRKESVQKYWELIALQSKLGTERITFLNRSDMELGKFASELAGGKPLWKLFILLSLIFVLVEILLLRFIKS